MRGSEIVAPIAVAAMVACAPALAGATKLQRRLRLTVLAPLVYGRAMPVARTRSRGRLALIVLLILATALVVACAAPRAARASVARGIADPTLTQVGPRLDPGTQAEAIDQIGAKLRASYVRFVVSWASAEPVKADEYNEAYLASVENALKLAQDQGLQVIVTFSDVPRWASNRAFWYRNPYQKKGYDRRYAMKTNTATLAAFQRFTRYVAHEFSAYDVWGYECWNEPNLHLTLYPQSTAKDKNYGAHVYIKMLKRFSRGISSGDRTAKRLAGATAPRGYAASSSLRLRRMMTSPQRFAQTIKAARVEKYFDAYSHHPYTPGASRKNQPEAAPRDPKTTVNLRNLGTLLRMFPKKSFYLTEYGYQTTACGSFSGQKVSLTQQASYLRRAYTYAKRYRQVKLLMWFLLDDFSPSSNPKDWAGFYTGLREITDQGMHPKPAYYVFANNTTLTLEAPASVTRGESVTLTGVLGSATAGPVDGATLVVQSRTSASGPWTTVGKPDTDVDGAYSITLTPSASAFYRVVWTAVATSPVRWVAVQ
jgi:hypothetical protein